MAENIYWGMNEKLRRYANDKNRQTAAEEAEKQTKIIEQAEQNKIRAMYDIARQQEQLREQDRIREKQEYNYRRNQQIFDTIGFSYDVVNDIMKMISYSEKKFEILHMFQEEGKDNIDVEIASPDNKEFMDEDYSRDKKDNMEYEFEEKYRSNEIVATYKDVEKDLFNTMDKRKFNINRIKISQWLLLIGGACLVFNMGVVATVIFSIYAVLMLVLVFNWIKLSAEDNKKSNVYYENGRVYRKLYDKYVNEKTRQLKSQYNNLIDEFQEFRKTNYNKEVETALDLVGLIDKNLLEESIGTKEAYKKYLNEFCDRLADVEGKIREIPCW